MARGIRRLCDGRRGGAGGGARRDYHNLTLTLILALLYQRTDKDQDDGM